MINYKGEGGFQGLLLGRELPSRVEHERKGAFPPVLRPPVVLAFFVLVLGGLPELLRVSVVKFLGVMVMVVVVVVVLFLLRGRERRQEVAHAHHALMPGKGRLAGAPHGSRVNKRR